MPPIYGIKRGALALNLVYVVALLAGQDTTALDGALLAAILGLSTLSWRGPRPRILIVLIGLLDAALLRREWLAVSGVPLLFVALIALAHGGGERRGWRHIALLGGIRLFMLFQLGEGYMALCQYGVLESRYYWGEEWIGGVPLAVENLKHLGRAPPPGFTTIHVSRCNEVREDWRATYTTDARGHRTVVGQTEGGPAIVLIGDSFTFGYGVNDKDAVASQLQTMTARKVINLGANGHGPSRNLLALEGVDPWPGLRDDEVIGDVVYMHIPHHLYDNGESEAWGIFAVKDETIFDLDSKGNLVRLKRALQPRPELGEVEVFLRRHIRLFKLTKRYSMPERVRDRWLDLGVKYCEGMDEVCARRWRAKFHVALLRTFNMSGLREESQAFKLRLKGTTPVHVLDYQNLAGDGLRELDYDLTSRHFTAGYSRKIAQALARDLGLSD